MDGLRAKGAPKLDLLPEGRGIVMVEFGADDPESARDMAQQVHRSFEARPRCADSRLYTKDEARHVWSLRESGPRAAALLPVRSPVGRLGRLGRGS